MAGHTYALADTNSVSRHSEEEGRNSSSSKSVAGHGRLCMCSYSSLLSGIEIKMTTHVLWYQCERDLICKCC